MWRAINVDGTPTYSFVEALEASHPGYVVRVIGGAFFLTGMLCMAWNTWRTVQQAKTELEFYGIGSQGGNTKKSKFY